MVLPHSTGVGESVGGWSWVGGQAGHPADFEAVATYSVEPLAQKNGLLFVIFGLV